MDNVKLIYKADEKGVKIPDSALVYGCKKEDRDALGLLFERYHQIVYRFLARMSGTQDRDLDDLVQETFIQVFKSASNFKEKSSVKTWILAIAGNVARHYFRGESRRNRLLKIYKSTPPVIDDSLLEKAHLRQMIERLPEAITTLPYSLRVVFVLCVLEGMPGGEVSRVLNIPKGTVWRRLHRARKLLRDSIKWGEK